MANLEYRPVTHDHDAFLKEALKRKGFDGGTRTLQMNTLS